MYVELSVQTCRWLNRCSDRWPSEELMMRHMCLKWFGHRERMDNDNWISKCRKFKVDGTRGRGRPCKAWGHVIQGDLCNLGLEKGLTQDHNAWKRTFKKLPSNPLAWKKDYKGRC